MSWQLFMVLQEMVNLDNLSAGWGKLPLDVKQLSCPTCLVSPDRVIPDAIRDSAIRSRAIAIRITRSTRYHGAQFDTPISRETSASSCWWAVAAREASRKATSGSERVLRRNTSLHHILQESYAGVHQMQNNKELHAREHFFRVILQELQAGATLCFQPSESSTQERTCCFSLQKSSWQERYSC